MKKILAATTVLALALAIGGTALAQCGNCNQATQLNQAAPAKPASSDATESDLYRQFRQKTLDLRQEMMNKRFDLQRENLKATPDAAKTAALKTDIGAIQVRINQIRVQSGLPDDGKRDGECLKADGGCNKQNGPGGCNGQPCGQK